MRLRATLITAATCTAIVVAGLATASATGALNDAPAPLPTLGHAPQIEHTGPTAADDPCGYTPAIPRDNFKGIPRYNAREAAQPYTATMSTTQGVITFQALTGEAPCTTYSFRFLATHNYFDGTHCHRLTLRGIYVLQCGDPTGTGSGGPGYSFNDENLDGAMYPAGTVAMANAGPNTNGSQFFFCWKDTRLSPAYTPFGVVTGGLSVLQRIAARGDDSQNGPGDGYPNAYTEFAHVSIRATS